MHPLTFRRVLSVIVLGIALALAAHFSANGYLVMSRGIYHVVVAMGLALITLLLHRLNDSDDTVSLIDAVLAAMGAPLMCGSVYALSHEGTVASSVVGLIVSVVLLLVVALKLLKPDPHHTRRPYLGHG